MAKKPFEIQSADLIIGGVNLQAGTGSIVIPGVTQASNYRVEEVEDTDEDQTSTVEGTLAVLDAVQFNALSANPNADISGYATYTIELDDDFYIDEIEVDNPGSYTQQESTTNISSDMWVPGVSGDVFTNFNPADWFQVPFRPKMRVGHVENVGGGGGGSLSVGTGTGPSIENVTEILINGTVTEIEPGLVGISVSGEGLGSITVPAETGTTYKGLQVAYGQFHSNGQTSTKSVSKIVIHKPAATTVNITDDSNTDFFEVTGLGNSDVLAMFVVFGDSNGEKPLSQLQAFAEAVIDTVILNDGEEGVFNSAGVMTEAFYANYDLLKTEVFCDLDAVFFTSNFTLSSGVTTVREGSGVTFNITNNADSTYAVQAVSSAPGNNYLPGHKIRVPGSSLGVTTGRAATLSVTNGPNTNWPTIGIFANGVQISFTVDENGNATAIVDNSDSGFTVGQTFTVQGDSFTGLTTPADDVIFEVTSIDTSDNDAFITVNTVDEVGVITAVTVDGTAAPAPYPTTYENVTGTNYNVGSGFDVYNVQNSGGINLGLNNYGSNYVSGDVITLPGASMEGGVTPSNNLTITVLSTGPSGEAYNYNVTGTLPEIWPTNNINNGANDEYDTGNYINTNLAQQIGYNGGLLVADGTAAFGAGSAYNFVYDTGIFGLFVTGNSATTLGTSGNGPDSGSTIISGHIYGPSTTSQTYNNAVGYLNLIGDTWAGPIVSFTHTDNGDEVDILIPDDGEGGGVGITRDTDNGIYNPYRDEGWDGNVSPSGTLWNTDGWADLSDVEDRTYTNLFAAFGNSGLGNKIVGPECVMYLPDNGKYYTVKFDSWTQNGNGGGFSYTRREIDLDNLNTGIRFNDGTKLDSAEGLGRVKLESPGSRRIEEVHGYASVSVTARTTGITATTTVRNNNEGATWQFYMDVSGADLTAIQALSSSGLYYSVDVSLDQITWYSTTYGGGDGNTYAQMVLLDGHTLSVNQGDTIYYRFITGGDPVVWWNSSELPGGSGNFRGAIISYHAYDNNAGTMVGTIYTVDDNSSENVAHTEVFSGSSDGDSIVLWDQVQEGQLRFRRTNGEGTTIKIQWTAKVFYGSEFWD